MNKKILDFIKYSSNIFIFKFISAEININYQNPNVLIAFICCWAHYHKDVYNETIL